MKLGCTSETSVRKSDTLTLLQSIKDKFGSLEKYAGCACRRAMDVNKVCRGRRV